MINIEAIKADREAGTPGPWFIGKHSIGPKGEFGFLRHVVDMQWHDEQGHADARRIARVPKLEDALIASKEREDALLARVADLEDALQCIDTLALFTDLLDDIEIHMAEVAKAALAKPGDAPKVEPKEGE